MKKLTVFLLLHLILSCEHSRKEGKAKSQKQSNYVITIEISNLYKPYQTKYVLDNTWLDEKPTVDNLVFFKPLTLYRILYHHIIDSSGFQIVPKDTAKFNFSTDQSAQLFSLTKAYFKSLDFEKEDTMESRITNIHILDDRAEISISYKGVSLTSIIFSIDKQSSSNRQLQMLLEFIAPYDSKK